MLPTLRAYLFPTHPGDAVHLEGVRYEVQAACGDRARAFVCLTHQQRIPNQHHLEIHVETTTPPHVIARYCEACQCYENYGGLTDASIQ